MSTSNPSHLLISRNPRSLAHPQLVSSPTPLYAPSPAVPSVPLRSGSPDPATSKPPKPKTVRTSGTETDGDSADEVDDDDLAIHPTFCADAPNPGRVKVLVGRHEFYCHKDVLWYASPFFTALLQGSWAETAPVIDGPSSPADTDLAGEGDLSSILDIEAPRKDSSGDLGLPFEPEGLLASPEEHDSDPSDPKTSVYLDAVEDDPSVAEILRELREIPEPPARSPLEVLVERTSMEELSAASPPPVVDPVPLMVDQMADQLSSELQDDPKEKPEAEKEQRKRDRAERRRRSKRSADSLKSVGSLARPGQDLEAVVELHEESPGAFHDFLFWAYPHLECKVTWPNVAGLLALSSKLIVPPLQSMCERFLMTHASGRPVMALALAELHANSELYREASRFVLDQATWDQDELECLSEQTQLKLSKRRTWFLERLLKLGSIDVKKEYTCRPECPDPQRCAQQLDEKWRQAHQTLCRYGPPQPSVAFRALRQLDIFPTNPSLVMSHERCQTTAKTWVSSLFDRMFQPKMAFGALSPGTEKYWLYITLN